MRHCLFLLHINYLQPFRHIYDLHCRPVCYSLQPSVKEINNCFKKWIQMYPSINPRTQNTLHLCVLVQNCSRLCERVESRKLDLVRCCGKTSSTCGTLLRYERKKRLIHHVMKDRLHHRQYSGSSSRPNSSITSLVKGGSLSVANDNVCNWTQSPVWISQAFSVGYLKALTIFSQWHFNG